MALRIVYQTLKSRGNNEEVLAHGPYRCTDSNAWLHSGFYFWEEFIEPAHYWGRTHNNRKYIITKGECLLFEDQVYDLVGNMKHIREFKETIEFMEELELVDEETTVAHVIDFLIKEGVFEYIASRASTTDSFRAYNLNSLKYQNGFDTKLVLNPAIQLCIYDLDAAFFDGFEIAYSSEAEASA